MKRLIAGAFNSKVSEFLILVIVALAFVGCVPSPPAFTTGIRITMDYRQAGVGGGGAVPVVNGITHGVMGDTLGPPGPGAQTATGFAGQTNEFGIDDHPNARTNAEWTLTAEFAPVLPQCPPATETIPVPSVGEIADAHCIAF